MGLFNLFQKKQPPIEVAHPEVVEKSKHVNIVKKSNGDIVVIARVIEDITKYTITKSKRENDRMSMLGLDPIIDTKSCRIGAFKGSKNEAIQTFTLEKDLDAKTLPYVRFTWKNDKDNRHISIALEFYKQLNAQALEIEKAEELKV